MTYQPMQDLRTLAQLIDNALAFFDQFTDTSDPHYAISTYRPDLRLARRVVARATDLDIAGSDSTRAVLPLLLGLGYNEYLPAHLRNVEYTIALRLNENPDSEQWRQAWTHIGGILNGLLDVLDRCYADLT